MFWSQSHDASLIGLAVLRLGCLFYETQEGTSPKGLDTSDVSTLSSTTGSVVDRALPAIRATNLRVWVKGNLFRVCPLLNGDTYDVLGVHAKICTSLKLVGRDCIEYAADMKRIALRTVEQARHNAKTAIKKKIKSKFVVHVYRTTIYRGSA